jgi:flagellar motor switch protein FliG
MPAVTEIPSDSASREGSVLNKTQKLAALLVMLGPESASQLLKQFQPREIDSISREMARFNMITQNQQDEILSEFSEVAIEASTALTAGIDVTRNTLEKAVGSFKASDILGRVTPTRAPVGAMQSIADMDPRHIFNLIRDEQPQTIAFIVSYLSPEKDN